MMNTYTRCLAVCASVLLFSGPALQAADAPSAASGGWKFDFSNGTVKDGYTQVVPTAAYSDDTGFGYEPGTQVSYGDGGNTTTSERPI